MWYVIQTIAGKEEDLMVFIRALLGRENYEACFTVHAEWMKRLGGEWQIQIKPLFPGYVFIETQEPERIFMELKTVPGFSRLLGTGKDEFVPVRKGEEAFLRRLIQTEDLDHAVVGLTTVKTDEAGAVVSMEGALSFFEKEIETVNLHKRYAVVKTKMLGEERSLLFGIRLSRDRNVQRGRTVNVRPGQRGISREVCRI